LRSEKDAFSSGGKKIALGSTKKHNLNPSYDERRGKTGVEKGLQTCQKQEGVEKSIMEKSIRWAETKKLSSCRENF